MKASITGKKKQEMAKYLERKMPRRNLSFRQFEDSLGLLFGPLTEGTPPTSHAQPTTTAGVEPEAVPGTRGIPPVRLWPVESGQHDLSLQLWASCDMRPSLGPKSASSVDGLALSLQLRFSPYYVRCFTPPCLPFPLVFGGPAI